MNDDARVQELLAPMREYEPESDAVDLRVDREAVLDRMTTAAASPGRTLWAPAWQAGRWALAAAVALGISFAAYRNEQPPETVPAIQATLAVTEIEGPVDQIVDGRSVSLSPSTARSVPARGAIQTGAGARSIVRTAFGATLRLGSDTHLGGLEGLNQAGKVELTAGSVRCEVPKLPPGREFQVVTPEARVVVIGTVFAVSVRSIEGRSETTVAVEKGTVAVHHRTGKTLVHAHESWSSADVQAPPEPQPEPVTSARPKAGRAAPGAEKAPEGTPSGTLAEETRLLRTALRAERAGERERAQQLFGELLQRFPTSTLAPDAREGLARTRR